MYPLSPELLDRCASPVTAAENAGRVATALRAAGLRDIHLSLILEAAFSSAVPDVALNSLERMTNRLAFGSASSEGLALLLDASNALATDAELRRGIMEVLSHSDFLTEIVVADPSVITWLPQAGNLAEIRQLSDIRESLRSACEQGGHDAALRRCKVCRIHRFETVRIGLRDYAGLATAEENSRELSDLAQATIEWAAMEAWHSTVSKFGVLSADQATQPLPMPYEMARTTPELVVLGLGKLGGRELNFSSDVDLIFVYRDEGETAGLLPGGQKVHVQTRHMFFTRMGETMIRILTERGAHGTLYRVDMRLRPEGDTGPLVRSVESLADYLSSQARDWERVAYLKARVMIGPPAVAQWVYHVIGAFVFQPIEPARLYAEVESLKARIDAAARKGDKLLRDVKRGRGGIREIEFVVYTLQILNGRAHPALRVRNLFVAVRRLADAGIISPSDRDFYLSAYQFLRRVEHRLQMEHGRQEHLLPATPRHRAELALALGFSTHAAFENTWSSVTTEVHARFLQFFQTDTSVTTREAEDLAALLAREPDPDFTAEVLQRYGLEPVQSLRLFRELALGTSEVFVSAAGQRHFEQLAPALLRLASGRPRPGRVLIHLHSLMLRLRSMSYYYEVLAQHPEVLRLIVYLFGTSDRLSESLLAHPEFFDALIFSRALQVERDSTSAEAAAARLESAVFSTKRPQRQAVQLLRSARFEVLLSALRWLANIQQFPDVLVDLSRSADRVLQAAFAIAAGLVSERHPDWGSAPDLHQWSTTYISVLALGKYGSYELNFFGDLDVVPVYDDELPDDTGRGPETAAAIVEAVFAILGETDAGGRAFELDARLRPWGSAAPLLPTRSSLKQYIQHDAQPWEYLAYSRCRTAFGENWAYEEVQIALADVVRSTPRGRLLQEFRAMRQRLAESVDRPALELKRGIGGLTDCEFALQAYLLLERRPAAASESTQMQLWSNLAIDPALSQSQRDAAHALDYGYRRLRLFENVMRLVMGNGESRMPADPAQEEAVRRNLAIVGCVDYETDLVQTKAAIRAAYDCWMTALL